MYRSPLVSKFDVISIHSIFLFVATITDHSGCLGNVIFTLDSFDSIFNKLIFCHLIFSFFPFKSFFLFYFLSDLICSKTLEFRSFLLFRLLLLILKKNIFIKFRLEIDMVEFAHKRLKLFIINLL